MPRLTLLKTGVRAPVPGRVLRTFCGVRRLHLSDLGHRSQAWLGCGVSHAASHCCRVACVVMEALVPFSSIVPTRVARHY